MQKQDYQRQLEKEERDKLKTTQNALKQAVLIMRKENSEWQENCRAMADQNKQLVAEMNSCQRVEQEVQRHEVLVRQLDNVKVVFNEAHETAVADLKRLEDDCARETKERKKTQKWISSLVTLMDQRCSQANLLRRIHKIDHRCKAQRQLVVDVRRARKRSSKRSQRSGTTTVLRKKGKGYAYTNTGKRPHIGRSSSVERGIGETKGKGTNRQVGTATTEAIGTSKSTEGGNLRRNNSG